MNNIKKYKALGLSLLIVGFVANAQTTNLGELTISTDTQMSVLDDFNNIATGSTMNDGELFIYANFNNDGLFSYFNGANDGLIRFEGTNIQQITGTAISEFYNVLFDNSSAQNAFELSGEINIVNEADFDQGIVNNDDFGGSITFENLAYHINTSDDSHVDGLVYKNGNSEFDFPIGDSGFYRASLISAPNDTGDSFSSKYYLENSNTLHPHELAAGVIDFIDDTEYWELNQESGNTNVILTLSWSADTSPQEILNANPTAIHIVRWDALQGLWIDEGGIVDEDNQTVTTVAEVSGYGLFTLATVKEDLILPDNLVIYNSVSPNSDNKNDFFFIDGIENYPNNKVMLFNRWGVKVYEIEGYDNVDRAFKGLSDGRITISRGSQLPTGTYFYILEYEYTGGNSPRRIKQSGYLYLTTDD